MQYPTIEQVEAETSRLQLGTWLRHLPMASNEGEVKIINAVWDKFYADGQTWTPELSKQIGWESR